MVRVLIDLCIGVRRKDGKEKLYTLIASVYLKVFFSNIGRK